MITAEGVMWFVALAMVGMLLRRLILLVLWPLYVTRG